jgi:hypothetical protein
MYSSAAQIINVEHLNDDEEKREGNEVQQSLRRLLSVGLLGNHNSGVTVVVAVAVAVMVVVMVVVVVMVAMITISLVTETLI